MEKTENSTSFNITDIKNILKKRIELHKTFIDVNAGCINKAGDIKSIVTYVDAIKHCDLFIKEDEAILTEINKMLY